ncbi:hypothetical protein AZE42_06958 [Rhizopogon vesiculosus]|uniref:Uncharacterized protein n=1 Tax=Rhizopogon vesiculosus TaxID=180088 RepID=A0A1J8PLE6_9AGAM|nr:hypothetical protein AZE42_06958 [Rhizopogon vesiculosus]
MWLAKLAWGFRKRGYVLEGGDVFEVYCHRT